METLQPTFTFNFFRFDRSSGTTTTIPVRDASYADGMKTLIDTQYATLVKERVAGWAVKNNINLSEKPPYPSIKYPGKVWIEYRFGGLTL